ncbi:MAG: alpha/beta hydrolase [Sphingomonas sp.]|nr:alpha/beta hydrolase [Sphingomonas sp.]
MPRLPALARSAIFVILLGYAGALIMIFALQRQMIYPGTGPDDGSWNTPPPGYETVQLQTADNLSLRALYRAPKPGGKTLIFFHGNGDSALNSAFSLAPVLGETDGALMMSYRGYAGNPGQPSEDGLYADADAGLAYLRSRGTVDRSVVVGGFSLGTGVASQLATKGEFAGVLLIAPFTALSDVAADHFPWLPTSLLMRDRYLTRDRLVAGVPMLIVHGKRDGIIPVSHARRLAKMREDARLELFDSATHNDIGRIASHTMRDWLAGL